MDELIQRIPGIPRQTFSICPECLIKIPAQIQLDSGKLYMIKSCPQHGQFKHLYWSDPQLYSRFCRWESQPCQLSNPAQSQGNCPYDCGICSQHLSPSVLGIIDLTSRCNMKCPICFASSGDSDQASEPSAAQIRSIIDAFLRNEPPALGLQFSGGEPTLRDDLPELIRYAKSAGFNHVELNTNGIRLARDPDYCLELKSAGLGAVYLQFDGITSEPYLKLRGGDYLGIKLRALQNCRAAGLNVVLVMTLAKGVNDHQLGDLVRFACQNSDIVRCLNIQPISFCGRYDSQQLESARITIPDVIHGIESQTNGLISASDFYPVPAAIPIIKAVERFRNRRYARFSCHFCCGAATYLLDGIPISRYGDLDGILARLDAISNLGSSIWDKCKLGWNLLRIYLKLSPKLRRLVLRIIRTGSYSALRELHLRLVMIGIMHFMDPYNLDFQRLQRCIVHYGLPDGRIIPFCSYNIFHRSRSQLSA